MSEAEFTLVKQHGKLRLTAPHRYAQFEQAVGEGEELAMEIHPPRRRNRANRYYWGHVLDRACHATGHEPTEMHEFFVRLFLPDERKQIAFYSAITGETVEVEIDTRRSSKLGRQAFYDYVEKVRQFLAERGIETIDPDPEWWRNRKEAA